MQLKAKGINFKYKDDKYILKDIDFTIDSGEVVGLIAPSGFGKTTLAKILAGYEKPQSGSVTIDGNKFYDLFIKIENYCIYCLEKGNTYTCLKIGLV